MKLGTPAHPKFRRLMMRLDLKQYEAAGLLELLWAMAAQFTDDGNLSRFDCDDIAAYLDWRGDPQKLVDTLVECRWLDRDESSVSIHDWDDHMPHFITERVRKREQRAAKKPTQTDEQPGLSQDNDGTVGECCTESDLAQPSPAQASAAQPSQTNNSAASLAVAAEFEKIDLDVVRTKALALRAAAKNLDRVWVWQVVSVGELIDPDLVPAAVKRIQSRDVQKPQGYLEKVFREECNKRDRDFKELLRHAPHPPPAITSGVPPKPLPRAQVKAVPRPSPGLRIRSAEEAEEFDRRTAESLVSK